MADALKHPAHLMVAALDERHLVPGVVASLSWSGAARLGGPWGDLADARRRRPPAVERNAALQKRELLGPRVLAELDVIRPRDLGVPRHQVVRQLAVVGHDEQARGMVIQSPHRVNPLANAAEER